MSRDDDIKQLKARVKALEMEPPTHLLLLDLERRTEEAMEILSALTETPVSARFERRGK